MDGFEDRARAICEIGLIASGMPAGRAMKVAVDRYWPVYAVELQAGVINLNGRRSIAQLDAALDAFMRWKRQGKRRR